MRILLIAITALLVSCSGSNESQNMIETKSEYLIADFTQENGFTEGIEGAEYRNGYVYAVNYKTDGTIGRVSPDGISEVFVDLPKGSTGNGIQFVNDTIMYVADYTGHNVLKINILSKDIEVLAHSDSLNQPNDLAIYNDNVYCSDPNWSDSTGKLWFIVDNTPVMFESKVGTTNGIEVSPDGKFLYVNESVQKKVWKYPLKPSGMPEVEKKELFYEFKEGGQDGMRCDSQGNLWITRYGLGKIDILSKDGQLLNTYELKGQKPSNLAIVELEESTEVYVTLQDRGCIEKVTIPKL